MDRRTFIKLTAVTGTTATLAACGNPENQLVRFVPDEDIVPGQAAWLPSVCPLCSAGCGLTVRVMDADADVTVDGQTGVKRIKAAVARGSGAVERCWRVSGGESHQSDSIPKSSNTGSRLTSRTPSTTD